MRSRSHRILSALVVVLLAYIGYSEWRTRRAPHAESETVGTFDALMVRSVPARSDGGLPRLRRNGSTAEPSSRRRDLKRV